jgi:hypothetical protein
VLLFLHGVRHDDAAGDWHAALNGALRSDGSETIEERGFKVAPSYLDLLEAHSVPDHSRPPLTYVKESDDAYARAAGKYWSSLARLERSGLREWLHGRRRMRTCSAHANMCTT